MQKIETNRDPITKSHSLISPSPKNSFSSSSSSDFEFTISISPRKSSIALCPADELFCNGHLLPLHSRRNSLVPTLLSSSSTSSSVDSATTTTTSRDSTGSSSTDSSRSSSQNDPTRPTSSDAAADLNTRIRHRHDKKCKQFSFSRFSSVFRKEPKNINNVKTHGGDSKPPRVKGIGSTAKQVIKKYFRKVQLKIGSKSCHSSATPPLATESRNDSLLTSGTTEESSRFSLSFSGNLRYPRGRSNHLPSCPSSTRSSPSHSGVLRRGGVQSMSSVSGYGSSYSADMSSMEELHSAIQGAIAHCKNSLIHNKNSTINNANESSLS
ncbi:probable membrane-associated kinase regulator 1 [Benincasa hispida]|uniref:probable membrane-associated kinase regulator 1 n=1 Tax=Benincasa hispida TaxID=102211 RepID=UPI0019015253|nr:probable membrane-associated kinase regulator 1 [Benincasa hispida]